MDRITRFIECLVPVTACDLKCSYCYVIQENRRTEKLPIFHYSPERIGKALSAKRLGGICYVSICGAGETLIPREMTDIIRNILEQGHYMNITTNGTISKHFDEIAALPADLLRRLHFSFSFHYLELLRTNRLNDFFANIQKVKQAGCSFLVQINLCDDYLPYLDEIKSICEEKVGAAPQVAATRNERTQKITLMTNYSVEEYKRFGDIFQSPLFDFTMKNFMVKRHEFCYAGDWSAVLNLSTGEMRPCYATTFTQNIFENINKPIRFEAIGNNCKDPYCGNSSHYMALGVLPSISAPSYADLRNREQAGWYTPHMRSFLGQKLGSNHAEYSRMQKLRTNIKYFGKWYLQKGLRGTKKLMRILFHQSLQKG